MSLSTLAPADDFEGFEFQALVADFHTQPMGEPEPPQPSARPSRAAERRAAREVIDRELGIVRHRKHEREV